jgi:hypothetical protein
MLTKSEHIRRVLNKSFDMPAADVTDRLQNRGVDIDPGLVHAVRSAMRKERRQIVEQKQAEAEAEKAKLRAMASRVQETRLLNPRPLRDHIIDALCNHRQWSWTSGLPYIGLQMAEVIKRCRNTYKGGGTQEQFNQSVRKKLRMLVIAGEVCLLPTQTGDKYSPKKEYVSTGNGWVELEVDKLARPGLYPPLAKPVPSPVPVASGRLAELERKLDEGVKRNEVVAGTENGIAFLVGKLKEIVAKVGKKETKELIDVL